MSAVVVGVLEHMSVLIKKQSMHVTCPGYLILSCRVLPCLTSSGQKIAW